MLSYECVTAQCTLHHHTAYSTVRTAAPRPTSHFPASFNGSIMFIFFQNCPLGAGALFFALPCISIGPLLSFFFLSFLVFLGNHENGQKGKMVHAWKPEFPLFVHQCCFGTSVNSQSIHMAAAWQHHSSTAPQPTAVTYW